MSAARLRDVCDAAAAAVLAAWQASASPPAAGDTAQRGYALVIGFDPDQPDTLVGGRQVYVIPGTTGTPAVADRQSLWRHHEFHVLTVERYTTDAGPVPQAWIDTRLDFVEQVVFDLLNNPTTVLTGAVVPAARREPETPGTIDVVYHPGHLVENRAFWSECTFTYFEVTDYAGG